MLICKSWGRVIKVKDKEWVFSNAGPLAWNSLPADLQNIPVTSTFKKYLKTYLVISAMNIFVFGVSQIYFVM